LNIYFNDVPEEMHTIPCDWNFRSWQCYRDSICKDSVRDGISAIHGHGYSFISNRIEPVFRSTFLTFKNASLTYKFDLHEFIGRLRLGLDVEKGKKKQSACAKMPNFDYLLLRRLKQKLG